jgi:hypothetical protein
MAQVQDAAAKALGMTSTQLRSALRGCKSLVTIAQDQKVGVDSGPSYGHRLRGRAGRGGEGRNLDPDPGGQDQTLRSRGRSPSASTSRDQLKATATGRAVSRRRRPSQAPCRAPLRRSDPERRRSRSRRRRAHDQGRLLPGIAAARPEPCLKERPNTTRTGRFVILRGVPVLVRRMVRAWVLRRGSGGHRPEVLECHPLPGWRDFVTLGSARGSQGSH